MAFQVARWLRPKSNGVRVGRAAYRHIRRGDLARGKGDWPAAAAAYRSALRLAPDLPHIWVQLGHAAKEAGQLREASEAYREAATREPADPEPHLFLGHMAKRFGMDESSGHFLAALRRAPDNLTAVGEVMQHLLGRRRIDDAFLDEALTLLRIDRSEIRKQGASEPLPEGSLFLDVSDLLSYFSFSRIPSGVQRVQIEVVRALIVLPAAQKIGLCYYSPVRQGWTLLAHKTFADLCAAATSRTGQNDDNWGHELRLVYVTSTLSDEVAFPKNSVLVSLGANAPHANYLLDIRTACDRFGISYVPVIHDLIPMSHPEWVVPAHARDFATWLHSMLRTARGYLAISDATRTDLLDFANSKGFALDPDLVRVIKLHGGSIKSEDGGLPVSALAKWALKAEDYVLFVSTIEPRKNHVGAFKAWLKLAEDIGAARVPKFVCVGSKGWLNDHVHAMLADHALLRRKVMLLSGISDEELDLLYRQCAFVLYPSSFEGWGLPVTEALCYGKVPAVSNNSSLPEAGGAFAIYFDEDDPADMAAKLKPLILDTAYRRSLEQRIADDFRVPSWTDAGLSVIANAYEIADRLMALPGGNTPIAAIGTLYRLAAPERFDWEGGHHGEVFRHGAGWHLPDLTGCRVREEGGELRIGLAPSRDLVLAITLAAGKEAAGYRVEVGAADVRGDIEAGQERTVTFPLQDRAEEIRVRIVPTTEGPLRVVAFAIAGVSELV